MTPLRLVVPATVTTLWLRFVAKPIPCFRGPLPSDSQIPQSTLERMIATLCMLVGAAIFAYVVSSIVAIVASFGEEQQQ